MAPSPRTSQRTYRSSQSTSRKPANRWCCPITVLVLLLLAAAGGVLIWKYVVPQNVKMLTNTTIDNNNPLGNGDTPTSNYKFNQCNDTSGDCCNGVDSICDLGVDQIMFASVHNGQASIDEGFYLAGNHDTKLEEALTTGFRGINVDVGMCEGALQLIHGECKLGERDPATVFGNIVDFLKANPNEVLIMPMELVTVDGVSVELTDISTIVQDVGLEDYLYQHTEGDPWPTLRELIQADTRVLLFFYNYDGPSCSEVACPTGFHEYFKYAAETEYEFESVDAVSNLTRSCEITRGDQGTKDFFGVNDFVSNPLPSKKSAQTLNTLDFVTNRVDECSQLNNNLDVNLVYIDFWNVGDLVEFAQEYNKALGANSNNKNRNRGLLRSNGPYD